jgi:hypothetical protein
MEPVRVLAVPTAGSPADAHDPIPRLFREIGGVIPSG